MRKIIVPILNHEYKVIVCWGDIKHLRKVLLDHHYNPDNVSKSFIAEQTENRRGATFRQHRCYPVVWVNPELAYYETLGTLAHEAVHAIDFIFQAIDEDLYHSEVFAHSVGAIVRCVVERMGLKKDA